MHDTSISYIVHKKSPHKTSQQNSQIINDMKKPFEMFRGFKQLKAENPRNI